MTASTTQTADAADIYTRRESEARSYCRSFPTSFATGRNATMTEDEQRTHLAL